MMNKTFFVLIAFSLVIDIFAPLFLNRQAINSTISQLNKRVETPHVQVLPEKIIISDISLALPIVAASIQHDTWELPRVKAAFYGMGSALPGDTGTTVIFAHARTGLFKKLPELRKNTQIVLLNKSTIFIYTVNNVTAIKPQDVDFLTQQTQNTLGLFTCTGEKNEKRLLVTARLIATIPRLDDTKSLLTTYLTVRK